MHIYYVGFFGQILTFVVTYVLSSLFEPRRDLTGLTFWTQLGSSSSEE
jgi:hypothetical protein